MTCHDPLEIILARIDQRKVKLGLSDRGVSLESSRCADYLRSTRRQHARGTQHGITRETAEALARPLKTTAEWILHGIGPEEAIACHNALDMKEITLTGNSEIIIKFGAIQIRVNVERMVSACSTAQPAPPPPPK
jgi:hypothetical protein